MLAKVLERIAMLERVERQRYGGKSYFYNKEIYGRQLWRRQPELESLADIEDYETFAHQQLEQPMEASDVY